MMSRKLLVCAVSAALTGAVISSNAVAEDSTTGPFGFEPIDSSADTTAWVPGSTTPWKLPAGFSQSVVSDETSLNIYGGGRDDWHDMNTVNETGMKAGRYMYRTHEVRGVAEGGAVSVVDLKSGETKVITQEPTYDALDGIEWTPWGTVLFAEEVDGGRLFEIVLDKNDPTSGTVYDRPAVGRLAHEGVQVGPDGAVYVVDEQRGLTDSTGCGGSLPCGGGIYKFVPHRRGDLSSGDLYVLGIVAGDTFEGLGQGAWMGPIDPLNARQAGTLAGGQSYQRPEDLEIIGNTMYVAVTEGTRDATGRENYDGRVLAIDLNSLLVTDYVKPGVNVPVESGGQTGFDNPDNLAQSPDGKLIIIEDNVPSDIWFAGKDHDNDGAADATWLFGSLSDPGAEGTGIYFGKDPKTMYVNIQHSANVDGDGTWAIRKE